MTDKQIIIDDLMKQLNEKIVAIMLLRETLDRKEQECERLKEGLNLILTVQKNCKLCPHQKLDVDVLVCDLDCATAFKKIAKSTLQKCEVYTLADKILKICEVEDEF